MMKTTAAVIAALLLATPLAAAAGFPSLPTDGNETDATITFRLPSDGALMPLALVKCSFETPSGASVFEGFSDELGIIRFKIGAQRLKGNCTCNIADTPANDYAARVDGGHNATVFLHPASTVVGLVKSAGTAITGASVTISCAQSPEETPLAIKTDEYGSFITTTAPAGDCVVRAHSDSATAMTKILLRRGEVNIVELGLETPLEQTNGTLPLTIAAITGVAAVAAVGYAMSRRKPKAAEPVGKPAHAGGKPNSHDTDERMRAVMATLDERERKVVEYLLENGASRESTVRKDLMIPKATFFRLVKRLETRSVIAVDRHENRAVMRPTGWFLTGIHE